MRRPMSWVPCAILPRGSDEGLPVLGPPREANYPPRFASSGRAVVERPPLYVSSVGGGLDVGVAEALVELALVWV
jgi:hypothetical protein